MGEIVTTIVTSLTEMVTGSATAIGDGLVNFAFETSEGAITGLSPSGEVIFTMVGIGFGIGLMGVVFSLLKTR